MVILFYGLSGSGKTTLAQKIAKNIDKAVLLDGDEVRKGLNSDLGLSLEDRRENIRRTCEVAKLLHGQGLSVFISVICPTEEMRKMAKEIIGEDLFIVYLSTPLDVCKERDVKGLYATVGDKMTGIGSPFEEAKTFDFEIDTTNKDTDTCVREIMCAYLTHIWKNGR